MKIRRLALFLTGLALAFAVLPADALAQKSGFFFRGNVGPGYTSLTADDSGDTKVSGASGMVALAFGTFVRSNVAVYGEIFGSSMTGPTVESGGNSLDTGDEVTATMAGLGAGATVYTRSGVYFGGTVGFSTMTLEWDTGAMSYEAESDMGVGLSLLVGKEWRVGNKWGLGVTGHAITGVIPDQTDDTWTAMAFGVDFTFTYVGGGYR
jgi:hypothetical protein